MRSVEVEGNSRVDATRRALELLGAEIDDVKVEIVREEKRGFWSFLGLKRVTVRVTLVEENVLEEAGELINKLLSFFPVPVEARVGLHKNTVTFTLAGSELRAFQRKEDVADALGHIVELLLNRQARNKITVKAAFAEDAATREEELAALARRAADRAVGRRKEEPLPPMSARDRRTIHLTLERDQRVTTQSAGRDANRHVVVYPVAARKPARAAAAKRGAEERAKPPSRRRKNAPASKRRRRRTRPKTADADKKLPPAK